MEWVETVAKSVEEARELALDRLGVGEDDAEFEVLEEPKVGLFGRTRGEARVRARVRPTAVRPKQDRRNRGRAKGDRGSTSDADSRAGTVATDTDAVAESPLPSESPAREASPDKQNGSSAQSRSRHGQRNRSKQKEQAPMDTDDRETTSTDPVDPAEVGQAAVTFMTDLAAAFGTQATATLEIDGTELDVRLDGADLGLLIGPGGRTLQAVQDLARVASQRRLGDHETRLRIDVAGYRERRRAALENFAVAVANEVREQGRAKALEPMTSADRKVVHDAINDIEGVASHSDGEEPRRRVVITPA
jgi:spoIIIJ-associated protein